MLWLRQWKPREQWPWWLSHVLQDLLEALPFPMLDFPSVQYQRFVLPWPCFISSSAEGLHSSLLFSVIRMSHLPSELRMYHNPEFLTGWESHGNISEHLWGSFLRQSHPNLASSPSCVFPGLWGPGEAACEAEFCLPESYDWQSVLTLLQVGHGIVLFT